MERECGGGGVVGSFNYSFSLSFSSLSVRKQAKKRIFFNPTTLLIRLHFYGLINGVPMFSLQLDLRK